MKKYEKIWKKSNCDVRVTKLFCVSMQNFGMRKADRNVESFVNVEWGTAHEFYKKLFFTRYKYKEKKITVTNE